MLKSPRVAMETSRSLTCKGRDLMRSEWEEEEAAWVGARSSVAAGTGLEEDLWAGGRPEYLLRHAHPSAAGKPSLGGGYGEIRNTSSAP